MEGIRLVGNKATVALIVDEISDELRGLIRTRLSDYCYGAVFVAEDTAFYSFDKTIEQFLERFESKHKTTQIGMAGELLVHLLMPEAHPGLENASIFFNKEERSIKKGFDLTFFEGDSNAIWYAEVKSGEITAGSADQKASVLLSSAAADLSSKVQAGSPRSRWESAILDAGLSLQSKEASTVKGLLRRDATVVGNGVGLDVNAVLGVAVFHDPAHCFLDESAVIATAIAIADTRTFLGLRVIAAQQSVFDELIDFLKSEL